MRQSDIAPDALRRHRADKLFSLENRGLTARDSRFVVDKSGNCENPVSMVLRSAHPVQGDPDPAQAIVPIKNADHADLLVRCRKCDRCRAAKSRYWRERMISEMRNTSGRVWFSTLTLSPESQFQSLCATVSRLKRRGVIYDDLSADEKFAELTAMIYKKVQLYLKRLRKQGCGVRYCFVFEPHKSGLPHIHGLLCEASGEPLRHRLLNEQWRLGFSQFKLVAEGEETRAAFYVAKYLTKYGVSRMRASSRFGLEQLAEKAHPLGDSEKLNVGHRPSKSGVGDL